MPKKYDIETNGLKGYTGLSAAIVLKAVSDWRYLCEGNDETSSRNFIELKCFFENEAQIYLSCSKTTAEEILSLLRKEKQSSNYIEKREEKWKLKKRRKLRKRVKLLMEVNWTI